MKPLWRYGIILILFSSLTVVFNNCGGFHLGTKNGFEINKTEGTETGNAMASMAIADKACAVLVAGHPGLNLASCREGVIATSISQRLGAPDRVLNPYYTLVSAEEAGAIRADSVSLNSCLADFDSLNPQSAEVQNAYQTVGVNPYVNLAAMIPSGSTSCANVFRDNAFPEPPVLTDPAGMTTLDFDRIQPSGGSGSLIAGVLGEIDFGNGQDWNWQNPFAADTTNSIYSNGTMPQSFAFATGPKVLSSIEFFTQQSGLVTVSDDIGQSVTLNLPADGQMHLLQTNFTQPSSIITINFPHRYKLSLDNITYRVPANPSPIYFVQGMRAYSNTNRITTSFGSINKQGNTIIALVSWDYGQALQSLTDTQGNVYRPATEVIATPDFGNYFRSRMQIWYATNVKAGENTVRAQLIGTKLSTDSVYYDLYVYEYAGLDVADPLDAVSVQVGTSQQVSSGVLQTQYNDELIFAVIYMEMTDVDVTAGFTPRNVGPYVDLTKVGERIAREPGQHMITGIIPAGRSPWATVMVGFKAKTQAL